MCTDACQFWESTSEFHFHIFIIVLLFSIVEHMDTSLIIYIEKMCNSKDLGDSFSVPLY